MSKKSRTKADPDITLMIPAGGNEPMLAQTVRHAVKAAGCAIEVIVIDNGLVQSAEGLPCCRVIKPTWRGTSRSRHDAILAARSKIVVTIDAHVMMCNNWGADLLDVYRNADWDRSVSCGHVGHLSEAFTAEDVPCYHGAKLNWMDTSAEPRPLVARWCPQNKAGEPIGAIMGAYYAMRREWYLEMGRPWAFNRSWGCDEEIISLASWVSGGDCRLLPEHCASWHRFGHAGVAYTPEELAMVRANRWRLIAAFPFTDDQRGALARFGGMPAGWRDDDPALLAFREQHQTEECIANLQVYLEWQVTGFMDWSQRMDALHAASVVPKTSTTTKAAPPPPPARQPPAAPATHAQPQRLAPMPVDVCVQCGGCDTFNVSKTLPRIRRYKCRKCGRNAWRPREDSPLQFSVRND